MARYRKRKRARDTETSDMAAGTAASRSAEQRAALGIVPSRFAPLAESPANEGSGAQDSNGEGQEWTTVVKPPAKKRKIPKKDSPHYPSITYSTQSRLQSTVKLSDLQALVLYILADGVSPHWISVRHYTAIRKVVVLMVPGLELKMFGKNAAADDAENEEAPPASGARLDGVTADADGKSGGKGAVSAPRKRPPPPPPPKPYHPVDIAADALPAALQPLADIFAQVWPVMTPGDGNFTQMHSPVYAMLISPLPKAAKENGSNGPQESRAAPAWENKPTTVARLLASVDELREHEFPLHPALLHTEQEKLAESERRRQLKDADDWVDTRVSLDGQDAPEATSETEGGSGDAKNPTAGWEVLAMDCEMCMTSDGDLDLARISLVNWGGDVVMDELVKPEKTITDYLTPYSGITPELLEPVQTRLADIQARLLDLLHAKTILVGHSLRADLAALKLTHPFIIDTTILYPHPRGPPLRSSLKWLTQKYLRREIQQGHGTSGHSSVEDARACLDLLKQKCARGTMWGTREASSESIFRRLGRALRPAKQAPSGYATPRAGAVIDWGRPERGVGAPAAVCVGCRSDDEVVQGVRKAVLGAGDAALADVDMDVPADGVDFVWARLRELELARGWSSGKPGRDGGSSGPQPSSAPSPPQQQRQDENGEGGGVSTPLPPPSLDSASGAESEQVVSDALRSTVRQIAAVYDCLPPCTAFIVYSGSGDPRQMSRLQAQQQQFRHEFRTKKWDEVSVRWTDAEDQQLHQAVKRAREGMAMITVK